MTNSRTLIVFKPGTPKKVMEYMEDVKKLAQHYPKYLKNILLSNENFLQIIKYFESCKLKTFYVHKTEESEPLVLKYVCSISFPCLQILHLEKVKISSFDALQWIDSPHLIMLHLKDNLAISVKSLAKTKFCFIKQLGLDKKISHSELNRLTRMKLNSNTEVSNQAISQSQKQNSNGKTIFLIDFMMKMETREFAPLPKSNVWTIDKILERARQKKKRVK